jgi:uncharacterized protein YbaR (Trm112 family)
MPPTTHSDSLPNLDPILDLLACPACSSTLMVTPDGLACTGCGVVYPVVDGIPILLADRAIRPASSR